MSDQQELAGYVEVWWQAVNDFLDLLESRARGAVGHPDRPGRLGRPRGRQPHVAHLEGILAGAPEETADVGEPPHVTGFMGLYTEIGVVNRREASPDAIINEIRAAATTRHTALLEDPPTDAAALPSPIFGGVPWNWRTLLRNRPLDIWMHEQDVRRAVGRPGGMDTAPAQAHRRVPRGEPRLRPRQEGRRTGRHLAGPRHGGQRAVRVRDQRRRPRRAAARAAGRPDGDPADGPRELHPAGRRPLRRRARRGHASRATRTWASGSSRRSPPHRDRPRRRLVARPTSPTRPGRTILVTGTTVGGLGHHTALELARRGGRVVLAGRTEARLDETAATIRDEVPAADLEQLVVDLSDLGSVRRAAARGRGVRPDRRAGQQRRRDGHVLPADRRRPRAADGDQPLRAVPADRAAVPAAGRQRGRDRGDRVVDLPPDGPVGAAR